MNSELNSLTELIDTIKLISSWLISTIFDSVFLALWIVIQWVVNNLIIKPLELSGIDSLVLYLFQFMFAISTLAPVAITIYRNITIMLLRTQKNIRQEKRKSQIDESN